MSISYEPLIIDDRFGSFVEEIDSQVDCNFEEQLSWLRELVELPSDTDNRDNVEKAATFVDSTMEELNFQMERREDKSGVRADHRIYSSGATSDGDTTLALVGHVDTVYPDHWNWGRDDESGPIYGPGVMDMKGGLSVIVFALKALKGARPEQFKKLKVLFIMNTDEEKGSRSSKSIYQELADSGRMSSALVFEPGRAEDKIVTQRKGSAPFTVNAKGLSAHAGLNHRDGSNALHTLMLVGHHIESMTDYDKRISFNVVINPDAEANKSMKRNVVPKEASILVDCRFEQPGDADAAIKSLRDDIENWQLPGLEEMKPELAERVRRVGLEVDFNGENDEGRPPMNSTADIEDLRIRYEKHGEKCGLKVGAAPRQGGVSDANLIASHGVPVIDGLGPYGENAHKNGEEWFDPESLEKRTKALARFLCEEAT